MKRNIVFSIIMLVIVFHFQLPSFSNSEKIIYNGYYDNELLKTDFVRLGSDILNFNIIHKDLFVFLNKSKNYNTDHIRIFRKKLLLEKNSMKKQIIYKKLKKELRDFRLKNKYFYYDLIIDSYISIEMKKDLEETIITLEKHIIDNMILSIKPGKEDCWPSLYFSDSILYYNDYQIILLMGIANTLIGNFNKGRIFLLSFIFYVEDISNNYNQLTLNECFLYLDAFYYTLVCLNEENDYETAKKILQYSEKLYHKKYKIYSSSNKSSYQNIQIFPELWSLAQDYEELVKIIERNIQR